ncbi:MAG: urea transporter [Armatimonadetes bacterium]|nr:urea transporter [Armatimonadota bacterium]
MWLNKLLDFIDTILRSYSQILFCNSPKTGLFFLIATFLNPRLAVLGLLGGIFSNLGAYSLKIEKKLIKLGIFGLNGILIGLSWGLYLKISFLLILTLIFFCLISSFLIYFWISTIGKTYNLPSLSIFFVVLSWMGIIIFRNFWGNHLINLTSGFNIINQIEAILNKHLPLWFSLFFKSISAAFFQDFILGGILCFLGIFLYSKILALSALIGGILGIILLSSLYIPPNQIHHFNFNNIFISLALGGFFLILNWQSILYTFLALIACTILSLKIKFFLNYLHLPILAFPFNLITILFLLPFKLKILPNLGIKSLKLIEISTPEEHLRLNKTPKTKLILPFFGAWYVIQGNNGKITHKDMGCYAWDFIVVDDTGISFKNLGKNNLDYYAFGLPIIAPASGKIIKVENNILDNLPLKENSQNNWGNYVIIDHGNNEYSEISHFKYQSILVKEEDEVIQGQILGYCGSSGHSKEPHIHYQLQREPILESQTLPAKFYNFIRINHKEINKISSGIPKEGEMVKN